MTHRLAWLGAIVALLVAGATQPAIAAEPPHLRPNIVFVLIDDMG